MHRRSSVIAQTKRVPQQPWSFLSLSGTLGGGVGRNPGAKRHTVGMLPKNSSVYILWSFLYTKLHKPGCRYLRVYTTDIKPTNFQSFLVHFVVHFVVCCEERLDVDRDGFLSTSELKDFFGLELPLSSEAGRSRSHQDPPSQRGFEPTEWMGHRTWAIESIRISKDINPEQRWRAQPSWGPQLVTNIWKWITWVLGIGDRCPVDFAIAAMPCSGRLVRALACEMANLVINL